MNKSRKKKKIVKTDDEKKSFLNKKKIEWKPTNWSNIQQ